MSFFPYNYKSFSYWNVSSWLVFVICAFWFWFKTVFIFLFKKNSIYLLGVTWSRNLAVKHLSLKPSDWTQLTVFFLQHRRELSVSTELYCGCQELILLLSNFWICFMWCSQCLAGRFYGKWALVLMESNQVKLLL